MKKTRILSILLAFIMLFSNVSGIAISQAATLETGVNIGNDEIAIGNGYVYRRFSINDGKVKTSAIENRLNGITTVPQEGSHDFVINTLVEVEEVENTLPSIPTEGWKASLYNKDGVKYSDQNVSYLFDGNLNTYVDDYKITGYPTTLDIDFGEKLDISAMSVNKRPGFSDPAYGVNGTMGQYEIWTSQDGQEYEKLLEGEFTSSDYNLHEKDGVHNIGDLVYINFDSTVNTQYVRVVQKTPAFGKVQEFSSAEVDFYNEPIVIEEEDETQKPQTAIYSEDLTLDKAEEYAIEGGNGLKISYQPYEFNGITYEIAQFVEIENDKHYMRSYLTIDTNDKENAKIDYIDIDRFVIPEDAQGVWSRPEDSKISSMWIGRHELMLGQPIYMNGLFMGSEFPAADTIIKNNETQIRYYSGKNFIKLGEDNQLQEDGTFKTWPNVIGVSSSVETSVVRTDFFRYIEDIATPTQFRKQYNSWYDNMMSITDKSIENSFNGAEANLSKNGVEPLDSYVVDDGWINYYSVIGDTTYVSPSQNAGMETPNQTGFWEFNNKFPNEMYTSSELAKKFNSTFGLWVGPQGGYNYFNGFARFMEAMGTGDAQTDSALGTVIDTGSRRYLANFEKMAIDYQNRFDLAYWKWDGFASRPSYDKDNHHMVGGDYNMYFTSDMWESWTDLFDSVRENNPDIFINATCYINLSPWLLQWVNTIWIQDSGDTGQLGTGERHEQKIYYRDQVYYQLYKQNQIQFPLKNIYNHDPIYGVSDKSEASTEVFREFLFANAVRGTAFWELYFSPSIIDDAKWKVTADALDWAEANHEVLKNAILFGYQPKEGVYGYASFEGNEAIISFTNPLDTEQVYDLNLDDAISTPQHFSGKAIQVEPYEKDYLSDEYSYGDVLSVTLAPHETKILHFNGNESENPTIVSKEMVDDETLQIKFSERVNKDAQFKVNDKLVENAKLLDDYRTYEIKVDKELAGSELAVSINNLTDVYNNALADENITVHTYKGNVIGDIANVLEPVNVDEETEMLTYSLENEEITLTDEGFRGDGIFSAIFNISTEDSNTEILNQEDGFSVKIDEEGYVVAEVNGLEVSSKEEVTTVTQKAHGTFGTDEYVPTQTSTSYRGKVNDGNYHTVAVVREANGLLKIYVDGKLSASSYDENLVYEENDAKAITLGSEGLNAEFSDLRVMKKAFDYKEVEQYRGYADDPLSYVEKIPHTEITESGDESAYQTNASPLSNVNDGSTSTLAELMWNVEANQDENGNLPENVKLPQVITMTPNEPVEKLSKVVVHKRANGNGSIKTVQVLVYKDGEIVFDSEDLVLAQDDENIEINTNNISADYVEVIVKDTYDTEGSAPMMTIKEIELFENTRVDKPNNQEEVIDVEGYINYTTNLRETPNGKVIATIPAVTKVTGTEEGNWVKVSYDGVEGYVYKDLVYPNPLVEGYINYSTNLREIPNGEVISTIPAVTKVTGIQEGNWVKLTYNGVEGYVYKDLVYPNPLTVKGYINYSTNLRETPNGKVIATIPAVTKVTGTQEGNWVKVTYNGVEGYVYKDLVYPNPLTIKGYINYSTNLRETPNGKVISTIPGVTKVTGTQEGNWVKVSYNGQEGYVYKDLISENPLVKVVVKAQTNLRKTPNGKIITTISKSTQVSGIQEGNWVKINYNGVEGYVYSEFLEK